MMDTLEVMPTTVFIILHNNVQTTLDYYHLCTHETLFIHSNESILTIARPTLSRSNSSRVHNVRPSTYHSE